MSNTSYMSTRTRSARLALQDNALALREVRAFSYDRRDLPLTFVPKVQRDFSLTAYAIQQQDWCDMHRGAVASVGNKQYRATCYPLPVPVKRIRQGHKTEQTVLFLG